MLNDAQDTGAAAPAPSPDAPAVVGGVDRIDGRTVHGWAAWPDELGQRIPVELWLQGAPVARTLADQYRADLRESGVGDGRFAFRLDVPERFLGMGVLDVQVRIADGGALLPRGSFEVDLPADAPVSEAPTPALVDGRLDLCTPDGAVGWAAWADGRRSHVEVELRIDGVAATAITADRYREDLQALRVGNGRHGFVVPLPASLFDDRVHVIEVAAIDTGDVLPGCPLEVRFTPLQLWQARPDAEATARRKLGEAALKYLEALPDEHLGPEHHDVLLELLAWAKQVPGGKVERRAQDRLDQLTALRCELVVDGWLGPREVGGTLRDRWTADAVELQLLDGATVVATTDCEGGPRARSFSFELPEGLFDARIHHFRLRVLPHGGVLDFGSFVCDAAAAAPVLENHRALLADPLWKTLPALQEAQRRQRYAQPVPKAGAVEPPPPPDDETDAKGLLPLKLSYADALLADGQWDKARAEYQEARLLDPECEAAGLGEVHALLGAGEVDAARLALQQALAELPAAAGLLKLADELQARQRSKQVRVVAFYLPQFHPVPENDAWWGEGFTEWSNVAAATPLFAGHEQPRRPTTLGYYDLRLPQAANAQFDLARRYGVDGFCYYYYWFNGRRILEKPLQDLAEGRTGPFPFCICWANEDWTRSWDGATGEVLLHQEHSTEADLAFIQDLADLLRHPDYIRVDGKPVVMVYRADRMVDPKATAEAWRKWCRDEGIGELHLCAVQSFGFHDPRPVGFDAAVEFPPHCPWDRYPELRYLRTLDQQPGLVPGFSGKIYDYQGFAEAAMARPREPFMLHRTAMVAWDNTARRGKTAHVYHGFSVQTFENWVLANARRAALEQTDGLCFVNAWNEWAEGSVMEPDAHFGFEVLEAVRRAKKNALLETGQTYWRTGAPLFPESRADPRQRVLLFGHDAFPSGAQTNLLNMARTLKRQLHMDLTILVIDGGELLPEYERVAPTHVIGRDASWRDRLRALLRQLARQGARKAICNTVVTGDLTEVLKDEGYRVVGLLHELPNVIELSGLQAQCWRFADKTDAIVCASHVVADAFCERYWPDPRKILIAPQGIAFNRHHAAAKQLRAQVRKELGLPAASLIVMGCGYGDTRKGIDLFIQMAGEVMRSMAPGAVSFLWVGALEERLRHYLQADIRRMGLEPILHVTGHTPDPGRYFIASDLFTLTSREDPFPSVVMEAFDARMPVVAFDGGGGYVDIVGSETGALVPALDVPSMSQAVLRYLRDDALRQAVGDHNHALCRAKFGYEPYLRKLLALAGDVPAEQVAAGHLVRQPWFGSVPRPTITAIVPNYNYAGYLELRLRTVAGQTLPPDQIIVLDDASTDSSLAVIEAFAATCPIPVQVLRNEVNSGNTFVQWAQGLAQARGDLVWFAEADDYCEPTLLETLAAELRDEKVAAAWTDSIMVDEHGKGSGAQYKDYYGRNFGAKWRTHFRQQGMALIEDCLLVENIIPNASAVLFRRSAVSEADLALSQQYKFSGDWWFWMSLAASGDVVYRADPLNYHRRHRRSVMGAVLKAGAALLPETIGFWRRAVQRWPQAVSDRSARMVLERLDKLYAMFPELPAAHADIAAHPDYAADHAALVEDLLAAGAGAGDDSLAPVCLVLSTDVCASGGSGSMLLRATRARQPVRLVVLGEGEHARAFADEHRRLSQSVLLLPPPKDESDAARGGSPARKASGPMVKAAEQTVAQALARAAAGCAQVVSHGLLAHVGVLEAADAGLPDWTLLAGSEFDVMLGAALATPGVTLQTLSRAIGRADQARFFGGSAPHAFARMALQVMKPVDQWPIDPTLELPELQREATVPLRIVAPLAAAPEPAWNALAEVLDSCAESSGQPYELLLLHWGSEPASHREGPGSANGRMRTVELRGPIGRWGRLADLYLQIEGTAASRAVRLRDTAWLQLPVLRLSSPDATHPSEWANAERDRIQAALAALVLPSARPTEERPPAT